MSIASNPRRSSSPHPIILALSVAALACSAAASSAATNVALGKPVTLVGAFATGSAYLGDLPGVPRPGGLASAPASSVTDGIFQAGAWTDGVWWDEQNSGVHSFVVVDLQGLYSLTELSVMADENERYLIEYRNAQGQWLPVWEVPERFQGGLSYRSTVLGAAVDATALRLSALYDPTPGHDYAFSVSEIQTVAGPDPIFTWPPSPMPEPAGWAMMAAGLGLFGWLADRKARCPPGRGLNGPGISPVSGLAPV